MAKKAPELVSVRMCNAGHTVAGHHLPDDVIQLPADEAYLLAWQGYAQVVVSS